MRFIVPGGERVNMPTGIYKQSRYHRVRQRAHRILPGDEGRKIPELKKIFKADLTTIYNRFNAWESESPAGLHDRKGKGRKSGLTPETEGKIMERVKECPRKISRIWFFGILRGSKIRKARRAVIIIEKKIVRCFGTPKV